GNLLTWVTMGDAPTPLPVVRPCLTRTNVRRGRYASSANDSDLRSLQFSRSQVRCDVEFNFVTNAQLAPPTGQAGVMDENIARAIARGYKSKASVSDPPLNNSCFHNVYVSVVCEK